MPARAVTRRRLLLGGAGAAGLAVAGGTGYALMPRGWKGRLGLLPDPDPYIPDAAEGVVRLETVRSAARGQDVNLFTAVPAGHGNGGGLPVAVVLHGASATAADFQGFGLGRFLTAAVEAGAEPFVLAGADGGVLRWEPSGADDPQRMVLDEMPAWLEERGFDAGRRALWGWSMGGYGALRVAEVDPGWASAVAAFSPAVSAGDAVFTGADALAPVPLGVWCGTDDSFYDEVKALVSTLPEPPEVESYGEGGHTRAYWNDQTLDAFAFLARHLA